MKSAYYKTYYAIVLTVFCFFCPTHSLQAQNWTKLIQLKGTSGSSAFFFNANDGLIGTGHYLSNGPAQIYHTEDGGATWKLSYLQNPNIRGQVSDIFFRNRLSGWATIIEYEQTGWSGVYHSTDGGLTWNRILQAGFPAGIRETSRGVFYTDRDVNPGVKFSSDQGKTWTKIATTLTALGIDFMDDTTGFVTTQASDTDGLFPHIMTTDGGLTWKSIESLSEAWTPYGDPVTRSFILASERDQLAGGTESAIVKVPIKTATEGKLRTYGDSELSGGVAGSHICKSVIYVQGRMSSSNLPGGIIRSTDGGGSWVLIGGPNTIFDKRFAVTGRGAVVFAFDDSGGVWRTTDGGDGKLSLSVLTSVSIAVPTFAAASSCDTQSVPITIGYTTCDSARISNVEIVNDSQSEISINGAYGNYFNSSQSEILSLQYHPTHPEKFTVIISLTIEQPDGYTEDTTISIALSAGVPKTNELQIITNHISARPSLDTIAFDSVSTCADGEEQLTLANIGCGDITVDSMQTSGNPFSIASMFHPFALSSGDERTFLIRYSPNTIGTDRGVLYINQDGIRDTVVLVGAGYSAGNTVSLAVNGSILAAQCDSSAFSIALRNIACKAFIIDSISADTPFRVLPLTYDSLQPEAQQDIGFIFVPGHEGSDTGTIHITVSYAGSGTYDTTFRIVGVGIPGKPAFSVSRNAIQMGTVGVCSEISDTLVLTSHGCSLVTVAAVFDTVNGFSLASAPKPLLARGDTDVITINYIPNRTLGIQTANLIFNTSAGDDTVPIYVNVSADPGAVVLGVAQNISANVCATAPFTISIANSLCDSITLDSIRLTGANPEEFSLIDTLPVTLMPQQTKSIGGIFAPQDSAIRSASVMLAIRRADGTILDTMISIAAQGIGVPPIEVAFGATSFAAQAATQISIPITAKRGSVASMSALDFSLILNTDLLTPVSFGANGFFGNAVTKNITVNRAADGSSNDTVLVHLQLPSDVVLPVGELCEVLCNTYVTKTLSTNILLGYISFHDASGSEQCLSSETVPDTTAIFTLNQECGDTILSHLLGFRAIQIDGISPNPTSSNIKIQFSVPTDYANDAMLEIYDMLGQKLQMIPIVFPSIISGKQTMDIDLPGGDGILYLRVKTPSGLTGQTIPVAIVR